MWQLFVVVVVVVTVVLYVLLSEQLTERPLRFYHLRAYKVTDDESDKVDIFKDVRQWAAAIDRDLRTPTNFEHYHRGMMAQSGLPAKNRETEQTRVVVHVPGSYGGVTPRWPTINSCHALPIVDSTLRFVHLMLPNVTIIAFNMPTEGSAFCDFAQDNDMLVVAHALKMVFERFDKILLSGDCLGALRIERFLASPHSDFARARISKLILCSPIENCSRIFGTNSLVRNTLELVMPNFQRENDVTNRSPISISAHISLLADDSMCGENDLPSIRRRFPNSTPFIVPKGSLSIFGKPVVHGQLFRHISYHTSLMEFIGLDFVGGCRNDSWPVTAVTALYDIGRERNGDGRSFDNYLKWFGKTLALRIPMIVFVDPRHSDFVRRHRPQGYLTHLVAEPLHLPHLEIIRSILRERPVRPDQDLVQRLPEYGALIHNKFEWMKRSVKLNPLGSTVFIWVDAGQGRFWNKPIEGEWPHPSWVRRIKRSKQIWLQGRAEMPQNPSISHMEELIGTSTSYLWATTFAADTKTMRWLCDNMIDFLKIQLLQKKRIDTEQIALQSLWAQYPDQFRFIVPKHLYNWWGLCQSPELVPIWSHPANESF